jgi:molybdopterin molybdotransferase
MSELMNVDKALELILAAMPDIGTENLSIAQLHGRVLSDDIIADVNLPPFPNSSMDGFAVRAADVITAATDHPVSLAVTQDIPAGQAPDKPVRSGEAARIMTGAPMPDGADAIIPVENTDAKWREGDPAPAHVQIYSTVQPGDYVRPGGESVAIGQTILKAGAVLRAADVGMLASLGRASVSVNRRPRVVVLGSGDELVEPGAVLAPGQIYDSNSYMLAALVEETGAVAVRLPTARDTLDSLRATFQQAVAEQPDMIISSAGVSVGAADFTRQVLAELGEVGFWRINLRPGKPLAFGKVQNIPFFGLPGNPVSAMVTYDVLVRPALLAMARQADDAQYITAIAGENIKSDGRRSYLRITLLQENGQWVAHTTGTQSSGALMSMVTADALMIVPEDVTHVEAGTPMRVKLLKTPT